MTFHRPGHGAGSDQNEKKRYGARVNDLVYTNDEL